MPTIDPPTAPPERPCPVARGLSLQVWAEEDRDGFRIAVEEELARDTHAENLVDLLASPRPQWAWSTRFMDEIIEGLEKRLAGEVGRNWVAEWMGKRGAA
jgi:hypothetical protein